MFKSNLASNLPIEVYCFLCRAYHLTNDVRCPAVARRRADEARQQRRGR